MISSEQENSPSPMIKAIPDYERKYRMFIKRFLIHSLHSFEKNLIQTLYCEWWCVVCCVLYRGEALVSTSEKCYDNSKKCLEQMEVRIIVLLIGCHVYLSICLQFRCSSLRLKQLFRI